MNWCDKLASTPSVGFRFDHHFAPRAELLEVLNPILDPLVDKDKARFNIAQLADPFAVQFSTDGGFDYGVEPARVWINFKHQLKIKPVSGGRPGFEITSSAAPFSELLPELKTRLVNVARYLLEIKPIRKLIRVAIVTTTTVAEGDFPPGITRLREYLARPWPGGIGNCQFRITSELEKTKDSVDHCIHTLVMPDDPDQLPTLSFDWYRVFSDPPLASAELIKKEMDRAEIAATKYFEELAEGNRFDEELIRGRS